ncbi:pyridoxamine 5'-phosphate oxidase family protein [Flavobacterium zepuense]|uniref:Pyridoxamine 5'-phosphate oxidase family protein n=1 Tax=Flavobacterium zepuense TaxID=2593302 RepID=A0A552V1D3_9FLAO|nr:pyridoxamine 5'-phosphate oxidase family protein [Flavobacterium zepuense]TRW24267.1 pyridoxamine 5'-phosphate oxidase family protein [Flavobacterium zepuense]
MGNYKDLFSDEAKAKIKEMAEDIKMCMFCTELGVRPIPTRPMGVLNVDDEGNLWFLSSKKSNKNFEIQHDNEVQLIFAKNSDAHFLSVFGTATIYRDRAHVEEIWTPTAKTWFEEGKEDPDATVIKVTPSDAYYWDTKDGKMISLLKIAVGAIIGKTDDGGVEGRLNV